MSIQLQIEEMPGYLAAKFTGKGAAEEIWRQFETIAEYCKSANKNKLLIDFAGADIEISLADRYLSGESAEIFAPYKIIKTAFLGRPYQQDYKKFGEMVVQNRWVDARVFTTVGDAVEWLLKE